MNIGDRVSFGKYYQNSEREKNVIDWIVIDQDGPAVLLLSEKALDIACFDSNGVQRGTNWEKSEIRSWLNDTFFIEAFDEEERTKILKKRIVTAENISRQEYKENFQRRLAARFIHSGQEVDEAYVEYCTKILNITDQGKETYDKVFLLSTKEVESFLNLKETIKCTPTVFAQKKYDALDLCSDGGVDCCSWWLRSMGMEDFMASFVVDTVDPSDMNCTFINYVRPAIWADFSCNDTSHTKDRGNVQQETIQSFTILCKLQAHSSDGKHLESHYLTQKGYEEENRRMLLEILNLDPGVEFVLKTDVGIGETYVDGSDPLVYFRENDKCDESLGKAIQYALEDLKKPISSLRSDLFSQFYANDKTENLLDFAMMVIDAILMDRGIGKGGRSDGGKRLVAKVYRDAYDQAMHSFIHSFSFSLQNNMLSIDRISETDPLAGDFELMGTEMRDFDKEFVLSNVMPALYYSLIFLDEVPQKARDLFDYCLELA